jgi:hypothetical protein
LNNGETVVEHAILKGEKLLLQHFAARRFDMDSSACGRPPLYLLLGQGYYDVAVTFLENGAQAPDKFQSWVEKTFADLGEELTAAEAKFRKEQAESDRVIERLNSVKHSEYRTRLWGKINYYHEMVLGIDPEEIESVKRWEAELVAYDQPFDERIGGVVSSLRDYEGNYNYLMRSFKECRALHTYLSARI